jgi:type I restriction enzyme, R subunit
MTGLSSYRHAAHELNPIMDIAAQRFTTELELAEAGKIDFKIKAKQFVKI